MIDTDKMKKYLRWRGRLGMISREIDCPYLYLYRFVNGTTNQPQLTHLNKLEAWIQKDIRSFNKLRAGK